MSRKEEVFIPALEGKKIPVITLDNKWYQLMSRLEKTDEMQKLEESLKELIKRQGKLNNEIKEIKRQKKKLLDNIVEGMDGERERAQEEYRAQIEACNEKMDACEEELFALPAEIEGVNYELMLETMQLCYEIIQTNSSEIAEISEWISDVRIELKKNIVRKQQFEFQNQEMYSYMHDIFGPEVIDIFDMKYNPAEKVLTKGAKENKNS